MTAICVLSTLLTSQACSAGVTNTQVLPPKGQEMNVSEANTGRELQTVPVDGTSIKNTKGLIVLSDQYGKNDFIRFYNDDGSLWYEFSFYYEQIGDRTFPENENFRAFAFHRDYFVLALKCVGEDKNRYEVVVNEDTGLKKFVKKSDATLKFQTLDEHITKAFAIKFDRVKNPLLEAPNGKVRNVDLSPELTFHPVEVRGEWLKVRWDSSKDPKEQVLSGWVRWRDNDQILVELFYFA